MTGRIVITDKEITDLIENGSKENANILYNPESIHKWIADKVMKRYSLKYFGKEVVNAHLKGDIHLHDLEYGAIRPVCCQHDLRPFFMYGLKVDGIGSHTNVSKPAKHPEVAIQHAAKVMMAAQTNMSGGQSIDEFNVWLAPYVRGLKYEEIKQLMQMFIYELNQMYVARGGQVIFSSINCEMEVPDFLKDKEAIKGGEVIGTYGDYEEEVQMILEALVDVMLKGDAINKPFIFPNFIIKIRSKKVFDTELMTKIHKLIVKYGLPYFINMKPDWQVNNTNAMGCRTRLSGDWTGDAEIDTLRTGNMQWYTLNLPRIAYEARGNDDKLFEILKYKLDIIKDALLRKDEITKKRLYENKMMKFLTQRMGDESYYRYENTTKTFGFVGLNEMLKYHLGQELHDSKGALEFGERVIGYMREYADNLKKETGLRWTVTQTPAESTAGRFARLDWKYYRKECRTVVNGLSAKKPDNLYYTNSSHVRYDADVGLLSKIKIEEKFHPLCNGGHIGHFWISDAVNDENIMEELTKKIYEKSDIGFWTYTKDMSVCNNCKTLCYGLKDKCPKCGSNNIDRYSRVTGYLQNTNNWCASKRQELIERKRHSMIKP